MFKDVNLLAEICRLYYEEDYTQTQIAKNMYISRSKVSRILKKAKEEGFVKILINYPLERNKILEEKFKNLFNLEDVIILNVKENTPEKLLQSVTKFAANYLDSNLNNNTILGITWGATIKETVENLTPRKKLPNLVVAQLMGSIESNNPLIDGPDLVRKTANCYDGQYHYLMSPLFVDDPRTKEILLSRPIIKSTFNVAKNANVVLTGIGYISKENETSSWNVYMDTRASSLLESEEAVGHICGYHYDISGNLINTKFHDRILSIDVDILKNVKKRIGVACDPIKWAAITGAIKGQFINTLITDATTAQKIIDNL